MPVDQPGAFDPLTTSPYGADLDVRLSRLDGQVLVSVAGEIDMDSAPLLWQRLAEAIPLVDKRLIVDLSATTFVDSSGLAVFVRAYQDLRRRGAELVLRSPSTITRRAFAITALDTVITIEDRPAEPPADVPRQTHSASRALVA